MSEPWETVCLGDAVVSDDKLRKPVKSADRRPGPYPYWGASGIVDWVDEYIFDYPTMLVSEDGENLKTRKTPIAFLADGKYWVNNHAHVLRAAEGFDLRFLTYVVGLADISGFLTGSTQPKLTAGNLARIQFRAPCLAEQRRIAGVLGALDYLIEVDRGLIENLLAMVNAKFECQFGDRELSLRLGDLAGVIDCLHSKKPERVTSQHRLLQLSNILDSGQLDLDDSYGISVEDYRKWTKNIETREWDCVITNVGRVGAVARVPAGVAAALGRNMTAIRPEAPERDGAFLLAALLSRPVRREISLKTDSGTVMDALNVKNIPSLRLPAASSGERSEFQVLAQPCLQAADSLKVEIAELQATRDQLLPLLISGRVRVPEEVAA